MRASCSAVAALVVSLAAAAALAQVPERMTFTGRLVDDLGAPLAGPVDVELRVFDAASGGSALYAEQHLGTALDATGGFAVELGLGTSPSGPLDAALFSSADRWLEVTVDAEVLTPRQRIGSVPWALIAQQATALAGTAGELGYAFAYSETSPSYTPTGAYSFNSSGGAITITRNGVGDYTVRFAGLHPSDFAGGTVSVTGHGTGADFCKTAGWNGLGSPGDLDVAVRCFALGTGAPTDARFVVVYVR